MHHALGCSGDNRAADGANGGADRAACQADHAAGHGASSDRAAGGGMRFTLARDAVQIAIELCTTLGRSMPETTCTLRRDYLGPVGALDEVDGEFGPLFGYAAGGDGVGPPVGQVQVVGRRGRADDSGLDARRGGAKQQACVTRMEGVGDQQRGMQAATGQHVGGAAGLVDGALGRRVVEDDDRIRRQLGRRDASAVQLEPGGLEAVVWTRSFDTSTSFARPCVRSSSARSNRSGELPARTTITSLASGFSVAIRSVPALKNQTLTATSPAATSSARRVEFPYQVDSSRSSGVRNRGVTRTAPSQRPRSWAADSTARSASAPTSSRSL